MKKEHEIEDKEKLLIDHDKSHSKEIEKINKHALNWGEESKHVIKMAPLPLVPFGGHHKQNEHLGGLLNLGKVLKEVANSIAKPGKAPEHKKGNILPHHMLKPGQHPAHDKHGKEHDKNKKSHEEHGKKDHHDAKKTDAKKVETKDVKKVDNPKQEVKKDEAAKLPSPQKIN